MDINGKEENGDMWRSNIVLASRYENCSCREGGGFYKLVRRFLKEMKRKRVSALSY